MKRVFSAEVLPTVAHARNLLRAAGIDCEIRNENIGTLMGEVPFTAIWPELWVLNDADADEAERIIAREILEAGTGGGAEWKCRRCGTMNEAQFGVCWKCGEYVDEFA